MIAGALLATFLAALAGFAGGTYLTNTRVEIAQRAQAAAEAARDTATAAATACSTATQALIDASKAQAEAQRQAIEKARTAARSANARADAERNRKPAVPGNACASAEQENREWLTTRRKEPAQ